MDKNEIREWVKNRIKQLDKKYIEQSNEKITQKVLNLEEYIEAKSIFCYVSKKDEADTIKIILESLKQNKTVLVPKCISDTQMIVCEINSLEDLEEGTFGILEPKQGCKEVKKEEIELAIIPCLTADEKGNRIGYGRGYYDRFLANTTFKTVVLVRSELQKKDIPTESTDIKIDIVIDD